LNPVGLPPAGSRAAAMNRTSSRGVANTRWYGGEMTVRPCGTSRTRAISAFALPAAEVAGADFPDEVAAMAQVVFGQSALARVVGEATQGGAFC
jgi:hypothetical protein